MLPQRSTKMGKRIDGIEKTKAGQNKGYHSDQEPGSPRSARTMVMDGGSGRMTC